MIELKSASPADTLAVGRRTAALLRAGDIVLLSGHLGTGKTLLVAGIAEGLGVSEPVTSPSFVIAKTYDEGFIPIVHADAYRLGSSAEFDDLELPDLSRSGVLLIEWGTAVARGLPPDVLIIEIERVSEGERLIRFIPSGSWLGRSLEELVA